MYVFSSITSIYELNNDLTFSLSYSLIAGEKLAAISYRKLHLQGFNGLAITPREGEKKDARIKISATLPLE